MKNILSLLAVCFCVFQINNALAQTTSCSAATGFCTGVSYSVPNLTNNPSLGNGGAYGCLGSTPNPFWYYMEVAQPGHIGITLNQVSSTGSPIDIDFVLWGPFNSLAEACANYSAANIIDCSYSAAAQEYVNIPNTVSGQVYLMLITNFSGVSGTINFSSTSGSGTTGGTGQISIISDLPACPGDTVMLTASGGTSGSYTWSGPNNLNSISDTLYIPNLQATDLGVYTVTSGNGQCVSTQTVDVIAPFAPPAFSNSPVCPGAAISLFADSLSSYLSYSWTGPNGFTSSDQNPVIAGASSADAGLYSVYGLLNNCVSPVAIVEVEVTNVLNVSATNNSPLNQGGTLILSATGSVGIYSWTGPNGFMQTGQNPYIQNASPADSGTYTVSVESAGCISATTLTNVMVNPLNQLTGVVYDDVNDNGVQDSSETFLPGVMVMVQPGGYAAISNSQGMYSAYVPDGSYTVSLSGLAVNQTSNPASQTATVSGSTQVVNNLDLGVYSILINDLEVTITEVWTAAPGFVTKHRITYRNLGTTAMSGTVEYSPDSVLAITSFTTGGYTTIGNTMIWNFSNLLPNQFGHIYVSATVPVGTALGAILNSTAMVTPLAGDIDTLNNTFSLPQLVTGSWDPNDKGVQPIGQITPQFIAGGHDLLYTIRFQNTGTGPAVNVLIIDTLSAGLDMGTFRMVSSSHNYELTIKGNNVAEWHFANIMLPDSNSNEPGSHGDIHFRIKSKQSLIVGDEILNTAHIFFDFNEAVVTNTTQTPVGILATTEMPVNTSLNVFPNPNNGSFTLQLSNSEKGPVQLKVLNMLGQTILQEKTVCLTNNFQHRVELGKMPSGIYLLQVQQGKTSFSRRIVLQN